MRYQLYKDFRTGRIKIREKNTQLEIGTASALMISNASTSVDQRIRKCNLAEERRSHHAFVECEINCVEEFIPILGRELELIGGMPLCNYQGVNITYNPQCHETFVVRETGSPCKDYYRGGFVSSKYGLEFYE